MKEIDSKQLRELLAYNFFPSGNGLENEKIGEQLISENDADEAYDNVYSQLNLDYIEQTLVQSMKHFKGHTATLLFSGGIDSTYLATLLDVNQIDYELLHIKYMSYDETEQAKANAKMLGKKLDIIEVNDIEMMHTLPEILAKMSSPFERGSVLLTYFLLQKAGNRVIAGDSADYMFMPSFEKEHRAISTNKVQNSVITENEANKLNYKLNFKYSDNALQQLLFFDALHEIPFYYRAKYDMLRKDSQFIALPFQNIELIKYALQCKTLHKLPHKFFLHEMFEKYERHEFVKTAFKANRQDFKTIIDKYYNPQILRDAEINLQSFNVETITKVKLMIALVNAWQSQ